MADDATAALCGDANPWVGFKWTKKDAEGRTHEPIHAGSRPSLGAHEVARRITEKQREGWLRAFDRHAKAARPNGVRRGHKGTYSHAARGVLAYFLDLATTTGRIFPSYNHISEVLDLPRSLVHRILAQLEAGGWIKRERRFRAAVTAGQSGPQLQQDTNFYTVDLPTAAARLLSAWRRKVVEEEANPPSAEERAARDRARARETLGRRRRGLEQNLERVRGFLARATDRSAIRKLQAAVDQLELDIADSLRREAALSDNNVQRRTAEAERLWTSRESCKGGESSPGENLTKQGQGE
jgi:hypothetical protein